MNSLVLGYGLLGNEIVKQTNWDYISREKDNFDFRFLESYYKLLYDYDTIINCVGNTDTYCEDKSQMIFTNYYSVCILADYCNLTGKKLIHISSDYVYSNSVEFAKETDIPIHNNTWYSYSKLLADEYIEFKSKEFLIVRTSFKPKPFPYERAITCQYGNFDYVDVIAELIIKLIKDKANGIFNVGTEPKTIFELARQTNKNVIPCDSPVNINMPTNITMDLSKMKGFLKDHE